MRSAASAYEGVRGERVQKLAAVATVVSDCPFGSSRFMDLLSNEEFDVLCHHAARVTDYRGLDFDVVQALAENTNNIRKIIESMLPKGLRARWTRTFFHAIAPRDLRLAPCRLVN